MLLTLLPLSRLFGFLFFHWPFQVNFFLVIGLFLAHPYGQISNFPNIFLNPVQVLTDHFVFSLAIVSYDNVSFARSLSDFFCPLEAVNRQINQTAVIPNGYVLVEQSRVALNQVDPGLENRLEKFLCQYHGLIKVYSINNRFRTDLAGFFDPLGLLVYGLLGLLGLVLGDFCS